MKINTETKCITQTKKKQGYYTQSGEEIKRS